MDLTTSYLGFNLRNPIVASASPLSHSLDSMKRLEEAGVSAIVMYSLFEEQIVHESAELNHRLRYGTESVFEAQSYFPNVHDYHLGPDEYIELLHKAKQALGIPVMGSLNGITPGGWVQYAKKMQEAGADAVELNVYYIATDITMSAEDVEKRYVEVLREVKKTIKIPVAMKLSPFISSLPNFARRLDAAGVNGLVLFNRFYQPDIDLEALEVRPGIVLSDSYDSRLPLRWIGVLKGNIKASLAATTGVHTAEDVLKLTMAGADATMMCSSLLKHGPKHVTEVLDAIDQWMINHEYVSIAQMKGSMSQKSVSDPSAFERANYMKALNQYRENFNW